MFLFSLFRRKQQRPVILHFVTWYPSNDNHVEGIFIQRQIELLASDERFQHIVVRKNSKTVSVVGHLKNLAGFFDQDVIGSMPVISLPDQSGLYRKYFWRYKKAFEQMLLNRLVKRFQPDLLHLHVVYGFAREALYLKKKKGLPFIVSEHMGPFPFAWLHDQEAVVKEPMNEASAVVAVSTAQAMQIESYTDRKVLVIPNVVDEAIFRYEEKKLHKKDEHALHVVFVGIYAKAKGVDYLLRVFPAFVKAYPGSMLHLAGAASAERLHELQLLITKGGIENNVVFHGKLSATTLSKLYHTCDFYVCSSEWESFGLSALEALFTGLPVVSTNCGGVNDFIDAANGLLIENDQQESTLLQGLLQMARQLPSYDRKEIATRVREKFSNRMIKESYLSIYQQLLPTGNSIVEA